MQAITQEILDLLKNNQLPTALELATALAAKHPEDADAQHLLGLVHAKMGNLNKALVRFEQALQINSSNSIYHNNISNTYKLLGKPELAIRHLNEALRLAPNNAESYNNLGSLYYSTGQITQAIPLFEKAIRSNPFNWEAHYNLANCFIKQDMAIQSISHYESVIKLNPQHTNAKLNLAMTLVSLHDYATALPLLEEAATNNQQHAELQGHLAEAYLDLGKAEQAIQQFNKALSLDPKRAEWHHNLAVLYLRSQQRQLARQHFESSLQLEPDNQTARHMLAALEQDATIDTAPADYISQLFDQYAGYYDKHVKEKLHYQVPILLRRAISKYLTNFSKQQNIIDLGCGTGLCGVYFRDIADFLIGVDLSAAMLAQAKAMGAYDGLCRCNILETIPGQDRAVFNLALAADVFVYIGDLRPLFKILITALRPEAKIAFTVEDSDTDQDFILQKTGRFAHSAKYIADLCRDFNFRIDTLDQIKLREQDGQAINGRLYIITSLS